MVYIHPEKIFKNIFEKVAKYEEDMANFDDSPDIPNDTSQDPADIENLPRKEKPSVDTAFNSEIERLVYHEIVNGQCIQPETLIKLYKTLIFSDLAYSRGILIEHNTAIGESFAENLLSGLYGNVEIDYVVDLTLQSEELELRKKGVRYNLKTLDLITSRELQLLKRPKVKKPVRYEDEELDEEDEEPITSVHDIDDSEQLEEHIPREADLLELPGYNSQFKEKLDFWFDSQLPYYRENLISMLKQNYYIQIDTTGLDHDDVTDLIKLKLDFVYPTRPLPVILEEGDNNLMANREGILPFRRWSFWKQIDPVSLLDEFVILNGKSEFAVDYCGRVFVFISEENRNKFFDNPKKYLKKLPDVPQNYRIAIFGPPKSGKNTIADMLGSIYGWKKVNLLQIYESVREYQKTLEEDVLNNVYSEKIHFSAAEWKDITTPPKKNEHRKPENFATKIVFMLDFLGIPLNKKMTFEEYKEEINYHTEKLHHLLNPPKPKGQQLEELLENIEQQNENMEGEGEQGEVREIGESLNGEAEGNIENIENNENVNFGEGVNQENLNPNARVPTLVKPGQPIISQEAAVIEMGVEEIPPEEEYVDPFPPEEDYVMEDLRSDEFYYQFNPDGTYPRPGGFILLSYPQTEDEIKKFAEFNIIFDKIIHLVDQSEDPYKQLIARKNPNFLNLDEEKQGIELEKYKNEVTKVQEIIELLKTNYNRNEEDHVIEVNCVDSLDMIKEKLIMTLNPFITRLDPDDKIFTSADVGEEKPPIPRGEFGVFCPVTYKDENWLFYTTEEFECQLNHRRYRFASEKEMEAFKKDPIKYSSQDLEPVQVLPPHICVIGHQGAGVTHFTNILSRDFKLKKIELKKEFMAIWNQQRLKRKEGRLEKKREELTKQKEEQLQERREAIANNPDLAEQEFEEMNIEEMLINDQGLDEEDAEFNAVDNNKEIFKSLFLPNTPSIYDSSWYEMADITSLLELFYDTRRTPNAFIIIRVSLNTILERHFDQERIKSQHAEKVELSKLKKLEKIENLKQEKKQQRIEEMLQTSGEIDDRLFGLKDDGSDMPEELYALTPEEIEEIMEEEDPDLPELETLMATERDRLIQRYEENVNFINEFTEQLTEKMIPVISVGNDLEADRCLKNIHYQLAPFTTKRANLIERNLTYSFPEPLTIRNTKELINSQVVRLSAYGTYSPVNPDKLVPKTAFPCIYRDRVYFFNNEDERKLFSQEPLNYRTGREFPLDVIPNLREVIYVIGNMRSGKTTISKLLAECGYYRISLKRAIADLLNMLQDCLFKREIFETLTGGESIGDSLAVRIIAKRVNMHDLVGKNIVLDGFPFNLSQVDCLEKEGITPNYVFMCEYPETKCLKRCLDLQGFKGLHNIIKERFKNRKEHLIDIHQACLKKNYSMRYINNEKNIWFTKDIIIDLIQTKRKEEYIFARNVVDDKPAVVSNILPRKCLTSLIETKEKIFMYSPVSLKNKNSFVFLKHKLDYLAFYKGQLYFLHDEEEFKHFTKNSELYINVLEKFRYDFKPPKVCRFEKSAELVTRDETYEYQDCCTVSIYHEKQVKEGRKCLTVEYKEKYYKFDTAEKMLKFIICPDIYINMVVPVKTVNENLKPNIQVNFDNAVSYLESNFSSLIMKGMLELLINKNKIKYPFLSVKETSIKYLALFLKANNPNNNQYAKSKYSKKFTEFVRNSMLPYELLDVYENYKKETNPLKKELIFKQLDNLSKKYDDLIEKANVQRNTRFDNFFKN
jgi:adenylate kinase family enzyme/YHS domain-containing protein